MRRPPVSWFVTVLLSACSGAVPVAPDAGPPDAGARPAHARLSWRVRCEGADPCEAPPERLFDADDGQLGASVTCDLSPSADGTTRAFSFAVAQGAAFGLRVRSATIGLDGDRIQGTGCTLAVVEETDLALEGACGPNPPSSGTPCQIQRIDILDVAGVRTLQAELRCAGLPARDAPGLTRAVTGPAGGATFATLELTGCAGL